jgi:hypothetical protein
LFLKFFRLAGGQRAAVGGFATSNNFSSIHKKLGWRRDASQPDGVTAAVPKPTSELTMIAFVLRLCAKQIQKQAP